MSDLSYVNDLFQRKGTGKSFAKGSALLNRGDDIPEVQYIIHGSVKITDNDRLGYGRTVAIFGQHHVLPISWLFTNAPKQGALYNYVALSDTETLCLPREVVRQALDASPEVYRYLCELTSKAYVNASARIHNLQKTNVNEKVEFVLYYLATCLADNIDGDVVVIDAALTHQDIADIAGLSRESVTNTLSKEKYRKVYWKKDGRTFVDISKIDVTHLPHIYTLNV